QQAHHARTRAALPGCWLLGGETTVTSRGSGSQGRGGRCQELALAAAIAIDGLPGVVVATYAPDGVDGPTDAAGAIVTGETCARARELGLDPRAMLETHDSHPILDRLGALIRTGP